MKRIILALTSVLIVSAAQAQNTNVGKQNFSRAEAPRENEFTGTEMTTTERSIAFTDIPNLPKPTWAIITDAEGEIIKQGRISPDNSDIDIHRLDKGMYFVSLVYKNKTMKAFVLQK